MKIIYFTSNLEGKDGWSRHSLGVIEYFKKKYEAVVLVSRLDPDLNIKQLQVLREPEVYLAKPWLVLWDLLKVRKVISKLSRSSDGNIVVHFLLEPYALFLPFLKKRFKAVLTLHGTYSIIPLKSIKTGFLAKKYIKLVDKIIAVSSFTRDFFIKEYPDLVPRDKFEVINNGINFSARGGPAFGWRVGQSLKTDKTKRILFVGMIKNRKGVHNLLGAVAKLRTKFKDFQVDVIGKYKENSAYFKKLKEIVRENNLEDCVYFRGKVSGEELDRYYRRSDVLVMPSVNEGYNFEGFGIVYLEANMFGVPVIGSINSGAEDAIIDGKTGFLVDPYDHKVLAEKILAATTSSVISPQDCIEWARKNDWSVKNKELGEVYKSL